MKHCQWRMWRYQRGPWRKSFTAQSTKKTLRIRERQGWVEIYHSERHDRKRLEGTARHDYCRNDVCSANGELRNLDRTSSSSRVIGMRLKEKKTCLSSGVCIFGRNLSKQTLRWQLHRVLGTSSVEVKLGGNNILTLPLWYQWLRRGTAGDSEGVGRFLTD